MALSSPSSDLSANPSPLAPNPLRAAGARLSPANVGDEEANDREMDQLRRITVKSLQNLASYPNPSRDNARKVLHRGASPYRPANAADYETMPQVRTGSADPKWQPPPGLKPQTYLRARADRSRQAVLPYANSPGSIIQGSHRSIDVKPWKSNERSQGVSLASGVGVPAPLTAGPPGQRQFRPSTFESTLSALRPLHKALHESGGHAEGGNPTMLQTGVDQESSQVQFGFSHAAEDETASETEDLSESLRAALTLDADRDSTPDAFMEDVSPVKPERNTEYKSIRTIGDSDPLEPLDYSSRNALLTEDWRGSTALSEGGSLGHRHRVGDRLKERQERIDHYWYDGTNVMGKTLEGAVQEAIQRQRRAVGTGLASLRPDVRKPENRPMSAEEATYTPTSLHAAPLLNMAFVSLLKFQQQQVNEREKKENQGLLEPHQESRSRLPTYKVGGQKL